jgi:hypothetical protein
METGMEVRVATEHVPQHVIFLGSKIDRSLGFAFAGRA